MVKCNNPHYHNDIIPFGSGITFDIDRIFDSIHICMQQDDIVFDLNMERYRYINQLYIFRYFTWWP